MSSLGKSHGLVIPPCYATLATLHRLAEGKPPPCKQATPELRRVNIEMIGDDVLGKTGHCKHTLRRTP